MQQALIVTTVHKGVFFGYGEPMTDSPTIKLERCRMVLYWPPETKGILGLATEGPLKGSRVGPAAPSIILRDVSAIIGVSEAAIAAWERAPWD